MVVILCSLLFLAAAGTSLVQDSPGELAKEFDRAQKLMVMGDFERAVGTYRALIRTPGGWLLRPARVEVTVGEERLPLRPAAAYQVASSLRRRGSGRLAGQPLAAPASSVAPSPAAAGGLPAVVPTAEDTIMGRQDLAQAARDYAVVAADSLAPGSLRERAAYQIGECHFAAGDYPAAVATLDTFCTRFTASSYLGAARYLQAWAHYRRGAWDAAAAAFLAVAAREDSSDRAYRSLLQAGECYEQLNRPRQARQTFEALAARLDPAPYEGRRRTDEVMRALREDYPATARELIGKAHVRAGDACLRLDSLETALTWYRRAAERFPTEPELVWTAWWRQLQAWRGRNDLPTATQVYHRALDEIRDPLYRARVQADYMNLAYAAGSFDTAAVAGAVYLDEYREQADAAGISVPQAWLLRAESLRLAGDRQGQQKAVGDTLCRQALAAYDSVLQQGTPDSLTSAALLGIGLCLRQTGRADSAAVLFTAAIEACPAGQAAAWARLHRAQWRESSGDTTGAAADYGQLSQSNEPELRDTALLDLAELRQHQGQVDQALVLLGRVPAASSRFVDAQLVLARLRTESGAAAQADSGLVLALQSTTAPAQRARLAHAIGLVAFEQAQYDRALQALQAVDPTQLPPVSLAEYRYVQGASRLQLGRPEEARDDLVQCFLGAADSTLRRQALELTAACLARLVPPDEGEARFREWMAAAPTVTRRDELRLALARFFYHTKTVTRAAACLAESSFTDPDLAAEAAVLHGEVLLADQQWTAGATALQGIPLAGLAPASAQRRLYLLAVAASNQGDGEATIGYLDHLLAAEPAAELAREGRWLKAQTLAALGRHREGADAFLDYAGRYPTDAHADEAAYLAGEQLYQVQDYLAAARAYEQVRAGAWRAAARLALAWCRLPTGGEAAFLAAVQAVQVESPETPQASQAALLAGDYFYNREDYPSARRAYQAVVDRYPGSAEARTAAGLLIELRDLEADLVYQAAMAVLDLGQHDQAVHLLQAVIDRYPDTLSEMAARCNLGTAYEQLGRWHDAVAVYDAVLQAAGDRSEYVDMVRFAQEHRQWIAEYRL